MKNAITESILLDYFNGNLSKQEEFAVREWSEASEENHTLFAQAQAEYLRMRWSVQASHVKVDYDAIRSRIAPSKKTLSKKIVAAIATVAAVAALILLLHNPAEPVQDFALLGHTDNNVILELSDGSQYRLDTAGTSLIEKDGTQLSIEGGQIAYSNDSEASTEIIYNKVIVPRGAAAYRVRLGDGSTVWVNSDSRLEYPLTFTGAERRVRLSGEAFFDVAKQAAKPFVVESDRQSVTVLGTQFNVKIYPSENAVTTLVSGKVSVQPALGKEVVTLAQGEQMIFDARTESISVSKVSVEDFIAWKDGVISVEKLSFPEILMRVSRKFDVEFDYLAAAMDDIVLKGSIPAMESLETVLAILGKAADVKFKIDKYGKIQVTRQ